MSNVLVVLTMIPLFIFLIIDDGDVVSYDIFTYILPFCIFLILSFNSFIQQIYAAQIYLWYTTWENRVIIAENLNESPPNIEDIEWPSFLDNVPEIIGQ